jgi:hypothetical protein
LKIRNVEAARAVIWPMPGWKGRRVLPKLAGEIGHEASNAASIFFAELTRNAPEHCRECLNKRANQAAAVFFLLVFISLSPKIPP